MSSTTKLLVIVIVSLACVWSYASAQAQMQQRRMIGGDMESTQLIVRTFCAPGGHDAKTVKNFFCCYNQIGKEQFLKCQMKTFGRLNDSVMNVEENCRPPASLMFMPYLQCLQTELKAAGIDFNQAATQINICMARTLGLL